MNHPRTIVIAGGSGFIGQLLATHFTGVGDHVHILTRGSHRDGTNGTYHHWDGRTQGDWSGLLDGADAVINLAGKNVNCRYTTANLHEIDTSRVDSVNAVTTAINNCKTPPAVYLQASTTAIYGDAGDTPCTEDTPPGSGIPVQTATRWEHAYHAAPTPDVRSALLRISFVLGQGGGALPILDRLTRAFLGGTVGSGRQFISWIHPGDLVAVIERALGDPSFQGTYNLASPNAATNRDFMRTLRAVRRRPWSPPVPSPFVHVGCLLMRTEPVLALTGRNAVPRRLLDAGFEFRQPDLPVALRNLLT